MKSVLWTLTVCVSVSASVGAQSIAESSQGASSAVSPVVNQSGAVQERMVSVSDALEVIAPKMPSALSRAKNQLSDTISLAALEHRIPPAAQKEADKGANAARKGRVQEALARYENAVSIDPDYLLARMNLGGLYLRTGADAKAAEQFQAVLRIDPRTAGAYAGLGTAELALGDPAAAETAARKAIEMDGALQVGRYVLGASLAAQRKSDNEAVANLVKATDIFPRARLLAARILAASGHLAAARTQLEQYLTAEPAEHGGEVKSWLAGLTRQ